MKDEEKTIILDKVIVELRRRYDLIVENYRSAQLKMITFLGAGFGLLSYLYSGSNSREFYFLPQQTYGIILYALSLCLIGGAMYKLYVTLRGFYWEYPCFAIKLKDIENNNSNLEVTRHIRNEYLRVIDLNQKVYDHIHSAINSSSLMLVSGGILVLLIKIFTE